jgi:hypothetical protein
VRTYLQTRSDPDGTLTGQFERQYPAGLVTNELRANLDRKTNGIHGRNLQNASTVETHNLLTFQ